MCRRKHHRTVEAHFFLYLLCKISHNCPRHRYRLEHLRVVSEHLHQLIIPVICLRTDELSRSGVGVFVLLHAGQQEVEIIRNHQKRSGFLQVFRIRLFHCHQLIDGIENLLLDACPFIQVFMRNYLVYFLVHAIRTAVTVSHCIAKNIVILIQKDIIHAPCINGHGYRNFADLFTFLQSVLNLCKQAVHIPAQSTVLIIHPIWEAVHFFELHLPVHDAPQHVSSAGCPNING